MKNNGTCSLAPLPAFINVSNAAQQFQRRRSENLNEEKQFSLRARQYKLGTEKRAAKMNEVDAQCKDVPLVQTTEHAINETEFEKFESGSIIIVEKDQQTRRCREGNIEMQHLNKFLKHYF